MKSSIIHLVIGWQILLGCAAVGISVRGQVNLVPRSPNLAPDYFCTWNIQGYTASYQAQRSQMTEENLFGHGQYQGWIRFFPKIRGDLLLVMDDSWDVPPDGDRAWFGSLILNEKRFPSYPGTPAERLKKLTADVKAAGWKGLGGWVCAQQAPKFALTSEDDYWSERLGWMRDAGFAYWKVDWGREAQNPAWRKRLTDLGHRIAPGLIIEHALTVDALNFGEVYRTYDVQTVIAAADTINRVAGFLDEKSSASGTALLNCEDEPYIAAGLGCVMGIERHPFTGSLPDGEQDFVFPPVGRDVKRRLDEIARAVRWHRIAAPLRVGATPVKIDDHRLEDTWTLGPHETWDTSHQVGEVLTASAPARIARGLELPEVKAGVDEPPPFILATRSANGAVAIASVGRTLGRQYLNTRAEVILSVGNAPGPFGVFGFYGSLQLRFDQPLGRCRILAQDLAADEAVDITSQVTINDRTLCIPGGVVSKIGLSAASPNDLSEPGMVLVLER